jgi:hypothetical protein
MSINQLSKQRIAILEDNPTNRGRLSDLVKMTGGIPVPASPYAPIFNDFDKFLRREMISMVICDHRLFEHGNYADYTGAKAIAESYRCGCGGVLVTSWENTDAESTIREYRRWIPSLIHSSDLRLDTLVPALLEADREVKQRIIGKNRIPYRTIMTIQRVVNRGTDKIVKVVMGQWNIDEEIGFPLRLIPKSIQANIIPGNMLIAQVNIDATRAEELFFDEFEIPDADVLKKSQTFFNHP